MTSVVIWAILGPLATPDATLIVTEHMPMAEVRAGRHPALADLIAESRVALVNCRTRSDDYSAGRIHREAYLLAAGSGSRPSPSGAGVPFPMEGAVVYHGLARTGGYGRLAGELRRHGYRVVAGTVDGTPLDEADPDPGLLALGPDRMAQAASGDGDGPVFRVLSVPPSYLASTLASAREDEAALFLLTMPPQPPTWRRERLALLAHHGQGAGLLRSPTTRRPGLIRVTDVGPTILSALGIDPPLDMEGRAARVEAAPVRGTLPHLAELQVRAMAAERGRSAAFHALMAAALIVPIVALGLWPFPAGTRWRAMAEMSAYGLLVVPGVLALAPVVGVDADPWLVVYVSFGVALLTAAALRLAVPRPWAPILALAATPVVLVADQLAGGWSAAFSYLGYSLQRDSRLYGIGNSMAILLVVYCLLLVGAAAESWPRMRGRAWMLMLAPLVVIGAPPIGANTGGLLTATFAALLALGLGIGSRRARWTVFLLAPVAAVMAVIAAGLYDVYAHHDPTTHLGHATHQVLSGHTEWLAETIGDKIVLVRRRFSTPLWWGSVGAAGLFLPFVWADTPRPSPWAPPLRYTLAGGVVSLFAGLVNDSGIVMTAMGCLPCLAAAALIHRRVARPEVKARG
ncbi:MAG: hypothetical protein GF320_03665 [Armatimonadia bacterium]|nr:hypothetical protein [Armatimonadia bacterium]